MRRIYGSERSVFFVLILWMKCSYARLNVNRIML